MWQRRLNGMENSVGVCLGNRRAFAIGMNGTKTGECRQVIREWRRKAEEGIATRLSLRRTRYFLERGMGAIEPFLFRALNLTQFRRATTVDISAAVVAPVSLTL